MRKKILTKKRALEIMSKFPRARVLVIGDIMVDHFIWGKVSRISPEAPVPVVDVARESLMWGGSANVLNNIMACGGNAALAGIIGNDAMGRWLKEEFAKRYIDTDGLVVDENRPTTVKTRIVAHSQQMVRFDRESREPMRAGSIEKIISYLKAVRNELGAVVISDYRKGVVTEQILSRIRETIAGSNIVSCVDPKHGDFTLYRDFDVITPNHHEAERALNFNDINGDRNETETMLSRAAQRLIERLNFKAVMITRGEKGISLFEKNGAVIHIPALAKEVFDVTGAGDTVIGVFALCVASGASLKEAADLANRAAGIVVGKIGTATVSMDEIAGSL